MFSFMSRKESHQPNNALVPTQVPGIYELPEWLNQPAVEISKEYHDFVLQNRARKSLFGYIRFLLQGHRNGHFNLESVDYLINQIVARNTIKFDHPSRVGYSSPIELKYFINLREASSIDLEYGSYILAQLVKDVVKHEEKAFTKIGAGLPGNPALGILVAKHLELPYVLVGESPVSNDTLMKVSQDQVVVIGDVISTGSSLISAVNTLRRNNARVTDAFCFIERDDVTNHGLPKASELLAQIGVQLHSAQLHNDQTLEALLHGKVKRS